MLIRSTKRLNFRPQAPFNLKRCPVLVTTPITPNNTVPYSTGITPRRGFLHIRLDKDMTLDGIDRSLQVDIFSLKKIPKDVSRIYTDEKKLKLLQITH